MDAINITLSFDPNDRLPHVVMILDVRVVTTIAAVRTTSKHASGRLGCDVTLHKISRSARPTDKTDEALLRT